MTYLARELEVRGVSPDAIVIREWRREHRLTQAEMAKLMGVSCDTLHRVELGRSGISERVWSRVQLLRAEWTESMRPAKTGPGSGSWKRRREVAA